MSPLLIGLPYTGLILFWDDQYEFSYSQFGVWNLMGCPRKTSDHNCPGPGLQLAKCQRRSITILMAWSKFRLRRSGQGDDGNINGWKDSTHGILMCWDDNISNKPYILSCGEMLLYIYIQNTAFCKIRHLG